MERELVESEIESHIQEIKVEWRETVTSMGSLRPPVGILKADVDAWKTQQITKSKQRLQQLEERLTRLQMLNAQVQRLKATNGRVSSNVPSSWGFSDALRSPTMQEFQYHPTQSLQVGNAEAPWLPWDNDLQAEVLEDRGQPGISKHNYARPITPGTIRQIIREEMQAQSTSQNSNSVNFLESNDKGLDVKSKAVSSIKRNPSQRGTDLADASKEGTHMQTDMPPHGAHVKEAWTLDVESGAVRHATSHGVGRKNHLGVGHDIARQALRSAHRWTRNINNFAAGLDLEMQVPVSCNMLFGGFSRRSFIRRKCFQIYTSPYWSAFFMLLTFASCVYITLIPEFNYLVVLENNMNAVDLPKEPSRVSFLLFFDLFAVTVMLMEILVGCIAVGFIRAKTSWLRSSDFHVLEFVVLIVTIAEYFSSWYGVQAVTLRPFRLLRLFKAITQIRTFSGVRTMISTLRQGGGQLGVVSAMLIFFTAAFSIFGMAIYMKSFRRRCVSIQHPIPQCSSDSKTGWSSACNMTDVDRTKVGAGGELVVSGGYPFETLCKIFPVSEYGDKYMDEYPVDANGNYHTCGVPEFLAGLPVYQQCESRMNPRFGFSHFDHVGGAMLAVSQVSAMDVSYDVLHQSLESEPLATSITYVYYFVITTFNTFLLLGLFVAVVTGTFKRVRETNIGKAAVSDSGQDSHPSTRDRARSRPGTRSRPWTRSSVQSQEGDSSAGMVAAASGLVRDRRFVHFMSLVIVAQSVAMAADQYDANKAWQAYTLDSYIAVAVIFVLESAVRFAAAGSAGNFWKSRFNRMEVFLNACSVIGLAAQQPLLTSLASTRLYRLMVYFPTLYELLESALSSIRAILDLILFIGMIAFCFAVTGRYIFGDQMNSYSRSNFGTFSNGMLTIFQLLSGDGWSDVLYAAMRSKDTPYGQAFAACFVLAWFVFARLIAANLFVAVIIENFEVSVTIDNIGKPGKFVKLRNSMAVAYRGIFHYAGALLDARNKVDPRTGQKQYELIKRDVDRSVHAIQGVDKAKKQYKDLLDHTALMSNEDPPPPAAVRRMVINEDMPLREVVRSCSISAEYSVAAKERVSPERILFLFSPTNPIRRFFVWFGKLFIFDMIVYVGIIVSCAFLVITPTYPDYPGQTIILDQSIIDLGNKIFTIVFTVEAFVRVMQHGLFFTKNAYLKSYWNLMDFVVLVFAWVDDSGILPEGGIVKVVRLARALRPLRLMKRNVGMRVVIDALILSLAPVAYVGIFSIFTFMVFSLIGMSLLGGKFYRCNTPGAEYPGGKAQCAGVDSTLEYLIPRTWTNPQYSFDTFLSSMSALFRVNNIKYVSMLYDSMDMTDYNQSPKVNNSPWHALFFVVYILVGALFVMNLFVGFIVDGFNANKGTTQADIQYVRFVRQLRIYRPRYEIFKNPSNRVSTSVRRVLTSPYFESLSAACVVINVLFMLTDHPDPSPIFNEIIFIQNTVFFGLLCLEIILNTIGFGPGGFVNDPWKMFDVLVALGTVAGYSANNQRLSQFAKSFRLMRIVRLMRMIKPIRVILETLLSTIPQLANILLLLFLVYSMFAVVAVQAYGSTKYGIRLGPTANFETWSHAILAIVQLVTGDEWQDLMQDCSVQPPACTPKFDSSVYGWTGKNYSFGDCGNNYASVFFITFVLVCGNVMLNLFIGMILDNFSFITDEVGHHEDESWSKGASSDQMKEIARCFMVFDRGTTYLPVSSLRPLLRIMSQPLGFTDTKTGFAEASPYTKAVEHLIRAELNLILYKEWQERKRIESKGVLRRLVTFDLMPKYKARFKMCVSFEDCIMTMLYWRLPNMVPDSIKIERYDRCQDTLRIANALIIVDFFRWIISRKKQHKMQKSLKQRAAFTAWQNTDVHRARRNGALLTVKAEVKAMMAANKNIGPVDALDATSIEIIPIQDVPVEVQSHQDAVDKYTSQSFPKPMHGMEVFLAQVADHVVVAKFLDPRTAERVRLCLIDFRKVVWRGWVVRNLTHDTLFEPARIQDRRAQVRWLQVDFCIKTNTSIYNPRYASMGSLIDVSSCVEVKQDKIDEQAQAQAAQLREDAALQASSKHVTEKKSGKATKAARLGRIAQEKPEVQDNKFAVSILRLNLGLLGTQTTKALPDLKVSEELRRDIQFKDEFYDACAQVVGYLPKSFILPKPNNKNVETDQPVWMKEQDADEPLESLVESIEEDEEGQELQGDQEQTISSPHIHAST